MAFFPDHKKTRSSPRDRYLWTQHACIKMRQYRLGESRVRRIIMFPARVEEGIIDGAIACMQPSHGKNYSEIWAMYVLVKDKKSHSRGEKLKIITAWRYPGRSPKRNPIPPNVIAGVRNALGSLL